jgi:AcrR family transcriptional regulator
MTMRSDTERNRRAIIDAAVVLCGDPGPNREVRMSDIAAQAGVSTATVYRHFASVEEILAVYRYDVGEQLKDYAQDSSARGLRLLEDVCKRWVELVVEHGRAMIHTRSDVGYLHRLREGKPYLSVQAVGLLPAISQGLFELDADIPGEQALFLWNILFDPREIFDLLHTLQLTPAEIARRLFQAFCGAAQGWQGAITELSATAGEPDAPADRDARTDRDTSTETR